MFASQGQAKRFFVDKVVTQASRDGQPLSENEQWMLSFSESDPEFVVDHSRVSALAAEIPDDKYEEKIAELARRACLADVASDPTALATYKEAFRVLNQGDHYLLIMLRRGLAKWLRPWWAFWW